jgi:hypothetical protein
VQRDDGRGTAVKGNTGGGWCYGYGGGKMETRLSGGKSDQS